MFIYFRSFSHIYLLTVEETPHRWFLIRQLTVLFAFRSDVQTPQVLFVFLSLQLMSGQVSIKSSNEEHSLCISKSLFITNSSTPRCIISAIDHVVKEHHNTKLKLCLIRWRTFIRLSARPAPSDHSVHLTTTKQLTENHYKHKPSRRFRMIITCSAKIRRADKMVVFMNVKRPVHLLTTEYEKFIAQWLLYAPSPFILNSESCRTAHYHFAWFSQAGEGV